MNANGTRRDVDDDGDLSIDPEWTTEILTRFVSAEVSRTGKSRVVLGLSGGIDSAVAAELAARALGPANVNCLLMPYRSSNAQSRPDGWGDRYNAPASTTPKLSTKIVL